MNASRRQFVQGIGIFGALFLGRSLMACAVRAGEAVGESGEALATCGDAVIGNNHGHSLQVSPEDVAAGVEKTYSIKGASSHDHRVTLTAADFAALAIGTSITVSSTTAGAHAHPVTVHCATTPDTDAGRTSDAGAAICPDGATATAISANHGHALAVPTEDVAAGIERTYSIKGTSSHDHIVTLTPDHFARLASGATISVTSTNAGGHAHIVKVICA
ncbi:MAG: hypothetical protein U0270_14620 [Labilithrix sp.]